MRTLREESRGSTSIRGARKRLAWLGNKFLRRGGGGGGEGAGQWRPLVGHGFDPKNLCDQAEVKYDDDGVRRVAYEMAISELVF